MCPCGSIFHESSFPVSITLVWIDLTTYISFSVSRISCLAPYVFSWRCNQVLKIEFLASNSVWYLPKILLTIPFFHQFFGSQLRISIVNINGYFCRIFQRSMAFRGWNLGLYPSFHDILFDHSHFSALSQSASSLLRSYILNDYVAYFHATLGVRECLECSFLSCILMALLFCIWSVFCLKIWFLCYFLAEPDINTYMLLFFRLVQPRLNSAFVISSYFPLTLYLSVFPLKSP